MEGGAILGSHSLFLERSHVASVSRDARFVDASRLCLALVEPDGEDLVHRQRQRIYDLEIPMCGIIGGRDGYAHCSTAHGCLELVCRWLVVVLVHLELLPVFTSFLIVVYADGCNGVADFFCNGDPDLLLTFSGSFVAGEFFHLVGVECVDVLWSDGRTGIVWSDDLGPFLVGVEYACRL